MITGPTAAGNQPEPADGLLLGPMVRHVDDTCASIWVETAAACTVEVRCGEDAWRAMTFAAHGHHYALVEVSGLTTGSVRPYAVHLDGALVWPVDDGFPDSMIVTLDPSKKPRLAFGSCRTSVPHDESGNRTHGIDAMRAYALSMAGPEHGRWPDLVLFLGDQVYADSTSRRDAGFHPQAPQHQGRARGRAEGLRGIRPPVPVGLVGPGQPLASLNPAQRHDLRRPRHPRRLELIAELETRDAEDQLVARTHRFRSWLVLDLSAPRQPLAQGTGSGSAVAAHLRPRRSRRIGSDRGPGRVRRARRCRA